MAFKDEYPLHSAVSDGDVELVRKLVLKGADLGLVYRDPSIEEQDAEYEGETPEQFAIRVANKTTVYLMSDGGAMSQEQYLSYGGNVDGFVLESYPENLRECDAFIKKALDDIHNIKKYKEDGKVYAWFEMYTTYNQIIALLRT